MNTEKTIRMMTLTIALVVVAGIWALLMLSSCSNAPVADTQRQEQALSEARQSTLLEVQPPPQIDYSLERENLIERVTRFNDPNKVSWIYLMSDMGQIYAFYTVKGKVSSVNSALTTPDQIVRKSSAGSYGYLVVESPQEDGSYGTNGDAIFFFTTEGVYVEWNGTYMLVDQPLQLSEQPLMIVTE